MTELVLHLGDKKAGSTAIQYALVGRAIVSPGRTLTYTATINHIPLADHLHRGTDMAERQALFDPIAKALARPDADVVVISAEKFEDTDPFVVREALQTYLPDHAATARLIAYVRPHADRVASAYAERVKKGAFEGSVDDFHARSLAHETFFYTPRFTRWREAFGDRFTLRPMIRPLLKDGDVVADFADFALKGAPFRIEGGSAANESLSVTDLSALRELHLMLAARPERMRVAKIERSASVEMQDIVAALPDRTGQKLRLHKALARQIQEAYAADAAALDAAFFQGTPMSDALAGAEERALDQPQSLRAEDVFSPTTLRTVRAWASLVAELMSSDPEAMHRRLRSGRIKRLNRESEAAGPAAS